MRRQAVRARRSLLAGLAAFAAVLASAAPASAATSSGTELHNARYCEILELKSLPPEGKVVVWNTIGLNDCPQAWWDGFDAASLAAISVVVDTFSAPFDRHRRTPNVYDKNSRIVFSS